MAGAGKTTASAAKSRSSSELDTSFKSASLIEPSDYGKTIESDSRCYTNGQWVPVKIQIARMLSSDSHAGIACEPGDIKHVIWLPDVISDQDKAKEKVTLEIVFPGCDKFGTHRLHRYPYRKCQVIMHLSDECDCKCGCGSRKQRIKIGTQRGVPMHVCVGERTVVTETMMVGQEPTLVTEKKMIWQPIGPADKNTENSLGFHRGEPPTAD